MSEIYERAIRNELAYWPGVDVEFGKRSKHRQAVFHYRGATRFIVYPDTPGDSQRGHLNCLSDVRRELAALGVDREERKPKKRKRQNRVVGRQMPRRPGWASRVEFAPVKPNPWEALAGIELPPTPEPREGHLRGALRLLAGSVRRMVARFRRNAPETASETPNADE